MNADECLQKTSEAAANIRTLLDGLEGIAQKRVDTEHVWKSAYNKALVEAEGPVEIRKAKAELQTEDLAIEAASALADERRAKESLHSWRSILSALQTVATGYREEARFARTGPGF